LIPAIKSWGCERVQNNLLRTGEGRLGRAFGKIRRANYQENRAFGKWSAWRHQTIRGHDVTYRLRMGDFRILFDVVKDAIIVQRIKDRKEAYD
jgi:mRNA-degrading endonuclease RelE of RelBE toxin-antitoxin system